MFCVLTGIALYVQHIAIETGNSCESSLYRSAYTQLKTVQGANVFSNSIIESED